jgi:hypothetical protein
MEVQGTVTFPLKEYPPLANDQQVGLASRPVWTLWKREKSLALDGN